MQRYYKITDFVAVAAVEQYEAKKDALCAAASAFASHFGGTAAVIPPENQRRHTSLTAGQSGRHLLCQARKWRGAVLLLVLVQCQTGDYRDGAVLGHAFYLRDVF